MGDHDLLERLVKAVESIALSLKVEKIATEFREGMKDEMDPKFFEAAKSVINIAHPNPNINMITTRETKENGTVIQEITETKESVNYIDLYPFNEIKVETDLSYLIKNNESGLIKWIAKQFIKEKKLAKDKKTIERIIIFDSKKWILEKPWKVDEK